MILKLKYIKTKNDVLIVFPELLKHTDFKHFNPVSAGFIKINAKTVKNGEQWYPETDCICYGESESLGLKSEEDIDTKLAKNQILGHLPE